MKKLLTVVSLMVVACSLHAASFSWGFSSGETKAPDGEYFGEGTFADASAFLYLGTASITGGKLDISDLTLVTYVGAMNPDPYYNWGVFDTSSLASSALVTTDAAQAYTLVLVAANGLTELNDGDTYQMVVANGTSEIAAIPGAGETTYFAKFENGTTFAAGNWTSTTVTTPEPTSGLLLILGMAGLALKRKRA